jgi:hypothetical protein
MATIKLSNTKVANRLISYAEKRAEEREGVDCPAEYAKSQMAATRELWGKNDGIQAHHVIQSFKPGEVTPEMANQIGQDLARDIAKGHECVVYTHTDKDHIHNHIVINSVSYEDGRKFHAHGKEAIDRVREASDRLCKERNLSVVKEPSAEQRYARAEYGLAKRGQMSWKDEIREVIDYEKRDSKSYEDFKKNLADKYNIEVKERGKNISFKHPDSQKFVRGKTLGLAYERGTLEDAFNRQAEREAGVSQERGNGEVRSGAREEVQRTGGTHERDQRTERSHEELHQGSHGQRRDKPNDDRPRANENKENKSRGSRKDGFDFDKARRHAERLRQSTAESYGKWQERDEREQSKDHSKDGRNRGNAEQQHEANEPKNERQHERVRTQDFELDR